MENEKVVVVEEEKRIKIFFKKHWKKIAISVGASAAVGTIIYVVTKGKFKKKEFFSMTKDSVSNVDTVIDELVKEGNITKFQMKYIDESIFTELAPSLEEAILNPDLEHVVLERVYNLDNMPKKVTVNIDNLG